MSGRGMVCTKECSALITGWLVSRTATQGGLRIVWIYMAPDYNGTTAFAHTRTHTFVRSGPHEMASETKHNSHYVIC